MHKWKKTLDPITYSGSLLINTFYTGFLIVFDFNANQQIKVSATYYTTKSSVFPEKISFKLYSQNYINCCGCLPTESPDVQYTPNPMGCPVVP